MCVKTCFETTCMDFRIDNGDADGMMMTISVENHNEMGESSGQAMIEQDDDENHNEIGENSNQEMPLEQDEKVDPDSIPLTVSDMAEEEVQGGDEPYVGQEFESEAAAHGFYNAYATKVGFVIRVSKLSRSRHDGSPIGRQLVCNKEGYRLPSKRDKVIRQRAETRVGCRAMILIRKENSGKWVITKFAKEHNHPLMPGRVRRGCIYDQYPNEHDKIQELMQQLAAEKKRAATYKRHLEMLFEQIEQHNESLTKRIQHIVDNVRDLERDHQQNQV
ncbi:hypothetical protein F2Q70_00041137 [Brassica cretica]|uniref:FAR1 domain-containing protein n=3 Tax=Brassica cretica TaxID=69181 RepID=A0A8S9K5A0_BRACR|nr:hypothetical protein F2Q70_00041137 [Brassica cretica]